MRPDETAPAPKHPKEVEGMQRASVSRYLPGALCAAAGITPGDLRHWQSQFEFTTGKPHPDGSASYSWADAIEARIVALLVDHGFTVGSAIRIAQACRPSVLVFAANSRQPDYVTNHDYTTFVSIHRENGAYVGHRWGLNDDPASLILRAGFVTTINTLQVALEVDRSLADSAIQSAIAEGMARGIRPPAHEASA